jgi:HlyD family secretion protein
LTQGCSRPAHPSFQGYIEADYLHVAAPVAGILLERPVQRGDSVAKGTPLFTLESAAEQAALAEAKGRLAQSQARLDNLRKGRRPSEIAALSARLAQARATRDLADLDFVRREQLQRQEALSTAELDQARSRRDADHALVAALEAELETARLGARDDEVRAAEQDVISSEATVRRALWSVEQKSQTSTVDAQVQDTLFEPGEFVPLGMPVVSLLPPDKVEVRFYVPQAELPARHSRNHHPSPPRRPAGSTASNHPLRVQPGGVHPTRDLQPRKPPKVGVSGESNLRRPPQSRPPTGPTRRCPMARRSMKRLSVAAAVSPAVEGGVPPPGVPDRANQDPAALSAGQDARLHGRRDACPYDFRVPALSGSRPLSRSISNRWLPMNPVSTTEAQRHGEIRQTAFDSVPPYLCGESLVGSWSSLVATCLPSILPTNLPSPRHRTPTPNRNPPASPGPWSQGISKFLENVPLHEFGKRSSR